MRNRLRVPAWLSVALWLSLSPLPLTPHSPEAKSVRPPAVFVIRNVTVIDATGSPPKAHYSVVITGDRISDMGAVGSVRVPRGARVVDATGKFLIPGLWDMHVHPMDDRLLPLYIANGVTGIRVMWGFPMHHEWRKAIRAGRLLGPRMVIASMIVGGPKPWWPGEVSVSNAAEARQAVNDAKQSGADFEKVYTFLPRDAYFAIADESKKLGIPFEGHLPLSVSAQEASNAGQKTFEHLFGVLPAVSTRERELEQAERADLAEEMTATSRPPFVGPHMHALRQVILDTYSADRAAALFALFRKNGTWQCPTFTVLRIGLKDFANDPSFSRDPGWLRYMPHRVRDRWGSPERVAEVSDKMNMTLTKAEFRQRLHLVGAMEKAGVGILAGTDTGNPFVFPGFSLHDELDLLVRAGLTPMEALQAATLNPARFLGREKDLGTVTTGKLADLVLLDASPLDDINNTRKIAAVIYGGRYFARAALDSMLTKVQSLASRKSIAEALRKTIAQAGVDSAVAQYHELKATQPTAYDFGVLELDQLGEQLFNARKFQAAIRIRQLNAESYPHSSIAYESLGEAYVAAGDTARATASFRKSLQLDPDNFLASRHLRKLGGGRSEGDR